MTDLDFAITHQKLAQIAELALELRGLDAYIERMRGSAPVLEAAGHVDLAIAVAGVQRVAHAQLAGDAG